ncbi:unnamed protein product, partial [Prorocentrum cordatum]
VDAQFNIKPQGLEVCFDPASQQQVLSFQFALTVSLPQLMQQLAEYRRGGAPPAPGLAPPQAPLTGQSGENGMGGE